MHWCKECKAKKSGNHRCHNEPLFVSYNYRLAIMKKYGIYIFPQKHFSLALEDSVRIGVNLHAQKQRIRFKKNFLTTPTR